MSLWNLFRGSSRAAASEPAADEVPATTPSALAGFESWLAALEATRAARWRAFEGIGTVSARPRPSTHTLSESPPTWAARTAFLCLARRPGRSILLTDGLSDPYNPKSGPALAPETGHGCELFVESHEPVPDVPPGAGESRPRHWLEHIMWHVADWEARGRTLLETVGKLGAITLEVPGCSELDAWRSQSGLLGLLIARPMAGFDTTLPLPLAPATLLSIQLLTPREIAYANAAGKNGGRAVAARLARAGIGHVASRFRSSVV